MNFWQRHQLRSQVREFLKAFRKQRVYNFDLLTATQRKIAVDYEEELAGEIKSKSEESLRLVLQEGDSIAAELFPLRKGDALRENVEVIFVAIVAALALRAFFLQPFKIPTDSMYPTLYGVQAEATKAAAPALPARIFDAVVFGRTFGSVGVDRDATLVDMKGGTFTPWLEYTDLVFDDGETRRVWIGPDVVRGKLHLWPGAQFPGGKTLHYVSDTGSQVLVDKFSYNFRLPKRGEVFVFRTNGIEGIESDLRQRGVFTSEFYIKRCVGVPGDTLRVVPPLLEINGSTAPVNFGMKRVESGTKGSDPHGYRGYSDLLDPVRQHFLREPSDTYRLEPDSYWAMGDNSYNSLDSRFWGPVPRSNLIGPGLVVYWPFGARWGFIR